MLKKIEKIQKIVDCLLGYLTQGGLEEPQLHSPETLSEEQRQSLGEAILQAHDGVLSPRLMLEMSRVLLHDERALRYYVDFQNLTVLLGEHFNPGRFTSRLRKADLLSVD